MPGRRRDAPHSRIIPKLEERISIQNSHGNAQRILTLSHVDNYVLTAGLGVITGLLILSELGISIAPVLGAAGVVGIAIAGIENWVDPDVLIRCRFRVKALEQWNVRREYLKRLKSNLEASAAQQVGETTGA